MNSYKPWTITSFDVGSKNLGICIMTFTKLIDLINYKDGESSYINLWEKVNLDEKSTDTKELHDNILVLIDNHWDLISASTKVINNLFFFKALQMMCIMCVF